MAEKRRWKLVQAALRAVELFLERHQICLEDVEIVVSGDSAWDVRPNRDERLDPWKILSRQEGGRRIAQALAKKTSPSSSRTHAEQSPPGSPAPLLP